LFNDSFFTLEEFLQPGSAVMLAVKGNDFTVLNQTQDSRQRKNPRRQRYIRDPSVSNMM